MIIDKEFARRDDCLSAMVPSDLRVLIAERDAALAKVEELEGGMSAEMFLDLAGELSGLRKQRDQLAAHLSFAVTMISMAGLGGNAQVDAMNAALASIDNEASQCP